MSLTQYEKAVDADAIAGNPPTVRDPALELAIDPAQRREGRADLPKAAGKPLGPASVMHLVRGSTALASGNLGGCVTGANDAVLIAKDDADAIFDRYATQIPRETPLRAARGSIDGHESRTALGDWGSVRMVKLDGRAVLLLRECLD